MVDNTKRVPIALAHHVTKATVDNTKRVPIALAHHVTKAMVDNTKRVPIMSLALAHHCH